MISIDFTDKTALITGSSQGIGQATAERFHAAGANVVVNFVSDDKGNNRERAETIVDRLGAARAIAVEADVRDRDSVAKCMETAKAKFGSIDFVINNAGIIRDKSFAKMTDEQWQDVIDINLTGVYNVCRAGVEHISDNGSIVNLSSIAAFLGAYGQANYASAKSGVIGLTRVLARELSKRGIRVNAVAPGVVDTDMVKTIPEQVLAQMLTQVPLGRCAEPREIADTIIFLCSDLASYITGQTIHVNGGWCG